MNEFHPSKVFRFCPFCGAAGVFEWNDANCFTCRNCRRRLYVNMAAAVVAVIFNASGELLLTRRKYNPAQGLLDLPGGFVNIGETAEHAVVREICEELNINISDLRFIATFPNEYVFGGMQYFTEDIVFACRATDFSTIRACDDVSSYEFMPPAQINIDGIGLKSIKNIVKFLQNNTQE